MSSRLDRQSRGNLEKASSRLFDKWISIMLQRAVTLSRYVVFVAVVASLAASVALILYEAAVVAEVIFTAVKRGGFQLQSGRALAIGLIEAIDVFLIAIVALVIGLGLHRLFVDEAMPLPRWLKIDDLEDLKGYLVSIVIAVLAVLFLRQDDAFRQYRTPGSGAWRSVPAELLAAGRCRR